jgi:hypothetical protein
MGHYLQLIRRTKRKLSEDERGVEKGKGEADTMMLREKRER